MNANTTETTTGSKVQTMAAAELLVLEPAVTKRLVTSFRARTVVDPQTGCWNWTGALRDRKGVRAARPVVRVGGKRVYVARASWSLRNKTPFPAGMLATHACDNLVCVNPEHVRPGTIESNNRESWERTRGAPCTDEQIDAMLACWQAFEGAKLTGRGRKAVVLSGVARAAGVPENVARAVIVRGAWMHGYRARKEAQCRA
jgi:hypothetical protein